MKLDFGEMDVLRDRHHGGLFVRDVNTAPFAPPTTLAERSWIQALDLTALHFLQMTERNRTSHAVSATSGVSIP
jgi:hypothetical protein